MGHCSVARRKAGKRDVIPSIKSGCCVWLDSNVHFAEVWCEKFKQNHSSNLTQALMYGLQTMGSD